MEASAKSSSTILGKAVIIVVVLAVAVAAFYYLFIDQYFSRLLQFKANDVMSAWSIPSELSHAQYLLVPINGGGVYANGTLTYSDYVKDGSLLLDIAYSGATEAKILYVPSINKYELVVNGVVELSSPTILRYLFVSEDGQYVSVGAHDKPGYEGQPENWTLHVMNVATRESWETEGFAGPFFGSKTLLAFRAEGIVAVDLLTKAEAPLVQKPIYGIYPGVASIPDGSEIGWTDSAGNATVLAIKENFPGAYATSSIATYQNIMGGIALSTTSLYDLMPRQGGGTNVMRYSFTGEAPVSIRLLPNILTLQKILP